MAKYKICREFRKYGNGNEEWKYFARDEYGYILPHSFSNSEKETISLITEIPQEELVKIIEL